MEIYRLHSDNLVSVRAYNVCKNEGFITVKDLVSYLSEHEGFMGLDNCGSKTNNELIKLSKLEPFNVNELASCIDISSLYFKGNMSASAYRLCMINGLITIKDLIENIFNYNNLVFLSDSDSEAIKELLMLASSDLLKYKDDVEEMELKKDAALEIGISNVKSATKYQMLEIVNDLSKRERSKINEFVMLLVDSLSARANKAISDYYNHDLRIKSILRKGDLVKELKSTSKNQIGVRTTNDIKYFYEKLFENIILVRDDPSLVKDQVLDLIFFQSEMDKSSIIDLNIKEYNGLQLLSLVIKKDVIFNGRGDIVLKSVNIYDDYRYRTLEDLGNSFNITRERVRQIRKKGLETLDNLLRNTKSLYVDDLFSLNFYDDELVQITNDMIEGINSKYDVSFSHDFIIYLYAVSSDDKVVFPSVDIDVLAKPHIISKNWKNYYLVDSDISEKVDLNAILKDIKEKKHLRIEEEYYLNFEVYLRSFLFDKKGSIDKVLLQVCEKIINKEAEVFLNIYDDLTFEVNVKKTVADLAYDILKEVDKPTKINELWSLLINKHPDFDKAESTFRNCFGYDIRFVPIGRQSVWGLKEWEGQKNDFLGGSMLEIVERLLRESEDPLHISSITNQVAKYRDIDEHRLLNNLKMNNNKGFVFIGNKYIGLEDRVYADRFTNMIREHKSKDARTWIESYEQLNIFINENNRLPKASDYDENSIRIYRWLGIQRKKFSENRLKESYAKKIKDILKYYG